MTKSRGNRKNRSNRKRPFGLTGGSAYANGGTGGGAADWVLKNFGTSDQQWNNTFGPNSLGANTGNLLPTVSGAPAVLPGMSPQGVNPPSQLFNFFKGGKGRGRKGKRRTQGGMGILTQAAVPLTLLAMQQAYGTRRKGNRRQVRSRSRSRRRR